MRKKSPKVSFFSLLLLSLAVSLATPSPARGQGHDLVMIPASIAANPNPVPRGCSTSLSARFRINGTDDFLIASGQVKIRFHYSDGSLPNPPVFPGPQWSSIGELTVNYTAADGPFAIGREWPTDFPSAAGASLSWTPPNAPSTYYVRAEVFYVGAVADVNPGDNAIVTQPPLASVAGNCSCPLCGVTRCFLFLSNERLFFCPNVGLVDICVRHPEICKPFEIWPPLCTLVRCPPSPCLTCPPEPFEVLFDNRVNDLRLVLFNQDGKQVATTETLGRPILVGKQAFNQRLRFMYQPGETYHVGVSPGDKTNKEMGHTLRLYVRRAVTQASQKAP